MSWMLSCIGCGGKKFVEKEETKVLDFQHYSLTSVPPYVFECERFLEELYLDFNQISELPKELFLCNELLTLSLSDNDLHNIPSAVSSLNNLTCLDISKNGISDIPDNIKSCKKLRSVNASTNPLCRLPEGFTQLVALKELSLSDTFLEYLPANFGRLTGLEVLELRENQLNTLPRSFTRLTALKRLDLGQNEFTELPEVVGHLTSLTDLWIDNNRVKRIPPEIGKLTRLTFLDASKNRINEIDSDIGNCKSLSHLYLTRNELEELPDSLSCCLKLSILHVDDNHLDHLPEHIGRLDRLVELKLCQNELSYLPSSVGLLRSLQFLHVDDNMLYTLPGELGSCTSLIVITATHNQITEMPAEMGSLTSLRVLSLCGNSIQSLPVSFSKLQLTALWLSENQAKPSVPLQCTSVAGQKVLTCFMLPQSETQIPSIPEDDRPLTEEEIEARRARRMIHFAADGDVKPSGRLTRVPTPYPKELRALAKHTKNILALKKEKEKSGSSTNKEEPVMKDAEKIVPLKESPNSSVAVKTSSAVIKPAAKKMSESAIEKSSSSSNEIGSLPEASVAIASTNSPSLSTPTKSSSSPPLCQNGILTSSSTLVAASRATDKSSEDLKHSKESTTEPEFSSVHSTSAVSSVHTSPSHHINPGSTLNHHFSETPAVSNPQNLLKLTEQPQRPASIALVESFISKGHDVKNYPSRPGSLALESAIPPWQNNRPGSLAAPINTVGIPMAASPQKSSSQNMLNQDHKKSPSFGEPLKPLHSPVTPVKKDNFSEILKENVEELPVKNQLVEIVIPEKMVEDSSSLTTVELASRPIEKETSTDGYLVYNKHDKKDTEELSSNTGLLSTISRVTEEGSDEDRSCSHSEMSDNKTEKVTSKIPKLPMSVGKTQYSLEENTENYQVSTAETQNFQSIPIVSPSAASSKIPHFSYSSKNVQMISPKAPVKDSVISQITSPKAPAKDSVISPMSSKILPPMSFTTSYSKISPDKVKSHIPTLASPSVKKDTNFETKHLEENQQTTRISRPNIEQTSKSVQQEIIPTGRDLTSPKGSSRIPMFSSPAYHSEIKSPSSIPSYPRSPPHTETDSFIPVKESDFNKKTPMSPVEKPINQTGIPILSPDDSSFERTSRIPTVSNSSLRGKKSGLPVLRTSSGKKVVDSSS